MRRFRAATLGHPIIMGRRTYDGLGGPLKYRHNIVVTSQKLVGAADAARDMNEALALAAHDDEVYIIGGADIYRQCLLHINRILLTEMLHPWEADTFFRIPFIEDWTKISSEDWSEGDPTTDCRFIEYRR